MNLQHKSRKILITGQSGTGKSTYFERYVQNAYHMLFDRVALFDHQGEFSFRTGYKSAVTVDDLDEHWEEGFVSFDPSHLFPGQTEQAWDFFCDWTFRQAKQRPDETKLLATDELQIFSTTSQIPHEMSCVIETGRKYGLDFCGISQQLNLLHNRMRNQMTEIVTFRAVDKLILDALERLGFDPAEVSDLDDGDYICRSMLYSHNERGNIFDIVY